MSLCIKCNKTLAIYHYHHNYEELIKDIKSNNFKAFCDIFNDTQCMYYLSRNMRDLASFNDTSIPFIYCESCWLMAYLES